MKTLRLFALMSGIALSSLTLFSCLDDDAYSLGDIYKPEIVTVVPEGNNAYSLRLDDGVTFWPVATNVPGYKPKVNQRALLYYTILGDSISGYSHAIKVNGIGDILTKALTVDLADKNDTEYGKDPVQIEAMEMGDGFLHIWLTANFGGEKAHLVNLFPVKDAESPYVLEFRHNAFDDPAVLAVTKVICFNLATLPDTEGKTVDLVVRTQAFSGKKEYTIKYNSDKTVATNSMQKPAMTKSISEGSSEGIR